TAALQRCCCGMLPGRYLTRRGAKRRRRTTSRCAFFLDRQTQAGLEWRRFGGARGGFASPQQEGTNMRNLGIAIPAGRGCLLLGAPALRAEPPLVEQYLHAGDLARGEEVLQAALKKEPKDDQLRFGLGTLRFIRAVEHLSQSMYHYGLRSDRGQRLNIPFL